MRAMTTATSARATVWPAVVLLLFLSGAARAATEIRVAPGDPGGLEGARDRAREMLRQRRGPLTILLAEGTYALERTLVLTASDSGTARAPVTWKAVSGARVRISGGRAIGGWTTAADPKILGRLDPAVRARVLVADLRAQGVTDFGTFRRRGFGLPNTASALELIADDAIMPLARHPTSGWLEVSATVSGHSTELMAAPEPGRGGGGAIERFAFQDAAVARWTPAPDLWVHGYWTFDWADTHDPVVAFDPARSEVSIRAPQSWYGVKTGCRFAFENALEALDAPGEWWLDRAAGRLYFLPPAAGLPKRTVVTLLETPLVSMEGASRVSLEGLIFEDARGDGVRIADGAGCRVAGCALRNLGGVGVAVRGGRGHLVRSCDVHDTGEGAITLDGGDRATLTPCGNAAENNDLHDYCRWSRTYRPGVLVAGVGCRVARNRIHDAPHNGILLGGNDHVIELNVLERVCLETGDTGAFYLGRNPTERGTVVRHNIFRDLKPSQSRPGEFNHVMAVYLDDCACGTRVEENFFMNAGWAVMIGGGRDNEVRGNVFVACEPAISVDARARGWAKDYYRAGGGWEMEKKLAAVPWTSAVWRARYPALTGYRLETCADPTGNRIMDNVCAGGRWLQLNDGLTERDMEVRGNLVESGPGTHRVQWPAIPLDRIGLERDALRAALP